MMMIKWSRIVPARADRGTPELAPALVFRRLRRSNALAFAARTSLTACAAYGVASLLGLEQPMWAPVSALIVVQGSARGTLRALVDRVLGTAIGAVAAVAVSALLASHGAPMVVQIAAAVALVAAVVATFRPAARVATWTSVIVLMSTITPGQPAKNAAWRLAGVALGAVVAALVGLVVGPAASGGALRRELGTALGAMADTLRRGAGGEASPGAVDAAETALRRCEALLADARRLRSVGDARSDAGAAVEATRRLLHSLVTLGRLLAPVRGDAGVAVNAVVDEATGMLAGHLEALADAIDGGGEPPDPADLDEIVHAVAAAVRGLRADGVMRRLSDAEAQAIYLRRFALERAVRDTADVSARAIATAA
jgi:uncharacterized membrane protein YccC